MDFLISKFFFGKKLGGGGGQMPPAPRATTAMTNICQKLLIQIPKPSKIFESYINKVNVKMDSKTLSINKLKDNFLNNNKQ